MKRRSGFTLVELLIVMAILAILGALAYPNYAGYIARTKRTEGLVALVEAMQAQERYYSRHNSYLAFSSDAAEPEAAAFHWWSGAAPEASAYELDGHACSGQTLAECIEIRARPGTRKVDTRFHDPECGALTLDSLGRQGAEGAGRCWP
jgi:type IV pilus assembly protein PilE